MQDLVETISEKLKGRGMMLSTAESCTGGLIATAITDRPGSSEIFDCGFVSYSYESKMDMLGVSQDTLNEHGAISSVVAESMVLGALQHSRANAAISCTGIAGPGGATESKPVGLVYIAVGLENHPVKSYEHRFEGNRAAVRQQTLEASLHHLLDLLE